MVSLLKKIKEKFSKKNSEKAVKTCIKYSKNPLKSQCGSDVHVYDEFEREWDYCKEHGCKICLGEAKDSQGKKKIRGGFYFCNENEECRKIFKNNNEALLKIEAGSEELRNQIFNESFAGAFAADDEANLKKLVNELEDDEKEAVSNNIYPKTVISTIFLDLIKARIEGFGFEVKIEGLEAESRNHSLLTPTERELLKGAYIKASGEVEATIKEKSAAFFKIFARRRFEKEKQDLIEELKKLADWNLLAESKKEEIINIVKGLSNNNYFQELLTQTKVAIEKAKKEVDDRERERERANPPVEPPTTNSP